MAEQYLALADLSEEDRELVLRALAASTQAYAPYSSFAVGAALRTLAGAVYAGANFENASYGLTICAEISALAAANAAGDFQVQTIAVVGHKFGADENAATVAPPCGRCRQLIFEASQLALSENPSSAKPVRVLSCNGALDRIVLRTIDELLPLAFGPANLGVTGNWPGMREELRVRTEALLARHRSH